jgi:hypothetical protein
MADAPQSAVERDLYTVLERACVRARLRTGVRSALRTADNAASPAAAVLDAGMGEALAECVRNLQALGLTEREALDDVRAAVDEVESRRRSTNERRTLLAEAQRRVRELYDAARV